MTNFRDVYLSTKGVVDKATLGDGVVQPEVLKKYIRDLVNEDTVFLKEAVEVGISNSESTLLPRLTIDGGFLHAGGSVAKDAKGEYVTADYNVNTNKLTCNPYVGAIKYEDDAVDVSIEGEGLGDTLTEEAANQSREEVESIALYSDTTVDNPDYNKADGLVKLAANKIYASELADTKASTIFEGLLDAVDAKYRKPNKFKIFVDPETFNSYLDELIARNTNLGDRVLENGGVSYVLYKGFKVFSTPVLASNPVDAEGKVAIGAFVNNATLKYFKELRVAGERKELDFATYIAMKAKFGFAYKNENVASVCYLTKTNA